MEAGRDGRPNERGERRQRVGQQEARLRLPFPLSSPTTQTDSGIQITSLSSSPPQSSRRGLNVSHNGGVMMRFRGTGVYTGCKPNTSRRSLPGGHAFRIGVEKGNGVRPALFVAGAVFYFWSIASLTSRSHEHAIERRQPLGRGAPDAVAPTPLIAAVAAGLPQSMLRWPGSGATPPGRLLDMAVRRRLLSFPSSLTQMSKAGAVVQDSAFPDINSETVEDAEKEGRFHAAVVDAQKSGWEMCSVPSRIVSNDRIGKRRACFYGR
ncbi:hypothetical protein MRX96_025650 [Rhipicephalus microplus]